MKKLVTIVLVVMLSLSALFAAPDVRFIFADLDQHPDILIGFCPTYVQLGVGLDFHLLGELNTSELQFIVGGGYTRRMVFIDPITEASEYTVSSGKGITYDVAHGDFSIRFNQGFLDNLMYLRVSYDMNYEKNMDNFTKNYGTLFDQLQKGNPLSNSDTIYPDLRGDANFLGSSLSIRFTYNDMEDTLFTNDGILAYAEATISPFFLNNWISGQGTGNYYSLTANAVFAKTLYTYSTPNYDWFSIVLVDRVNINWTDGSVPVSAQGPVSLGRKVRGYNTYSYGTQFSMVNNLDIRFAGPGLGLDGIRPRINMFLDLGLGAGNYFNTNTQPQGGVNFLSSVGAQIEMSFWDFIDLGYEMAYIFTGEKMTTPGGRFVTTFTFFLDF